MSVRGRLVAVVVAAALAPGLGAGPAAAQSTATVPGATVTVPGAGTTTPGAATTPGTTTTAPGATATTPGITAAQAGPGILLTAEDRVELASTLAEATEESGVCFGYRVDLGGSGAADRTEILSNVGPDRAPNTSDCPKGALTLQATVTYTSSSSESEDGASFSVAVDPPSLAGNATARLRDLTGVDGGDLVGNDDDLALRNLTAALPLLLDDATPAELPAAAATAPNGDRLTGSPSSDWLRAHGLGIGIAFVLLLVAVALVAGGLIGRRQSRQPKRPGSSPSSHTTST